MAHIPREKKPNQVPLGGKQGESHERTDMIQAELTLNCLSSLRTRDLLSNVSNVACGDLFDIFKSNLSRATTSANASLKSSDIFFSIGRLRMPSESLRNETER